MLLKLIHVSRHKLHFFNSISHITHYLFILSQSSSTLPSTQARCVSVDCGDAHLEVGKLGNAIAPPDDFALRYSVRLLLRVASQASQVAAAVSTSVKSTRKANGMGLYENEFELETKYTWCGSFITSFSIKWIPISIFVLSLRAFHLIFSPLL